jgi:hypothetical protein
MYFFGLALCDEDSGVTRTDVTVINADGNRTETVTDTNANG